jgi:hypothetical protein
MEKRIAKKAAPRRAVAATALATAALVLGVLGVLGVFGAAHGPAGARAMKEFVRTRLLEAPVLKAPLLNAERADQRRRG